MASGLTWLQAYALATSPDTQRPVRRDADRLWTYTEAPPLWMQWIPATDTVPEALHVVQNTESTAAHFLATDWTDEPWVDATTTSGLGPMPPGFSPTPVPQSSAPAADVTGNFGSASNPPGPTSQAQLPPDGSGYSGGGIGGGGGETTFVPHNYPESNNPVVTLAIIPPTDEDLYAADHRYNKDTKDFTPTGDLSAPLDLATLGFQVTIAGGPAGIYFINYTTPGAAPGNDNGYQGFTAVRFATSVSFLPGSKVTVTATYTVGGVPYTGSATFTFPDWHGYVRPTALSVAAVDGAGLSVQVNGTTDPTDLHMVTLSGGDIDTTSGGPIYPGGPGVIIPFTGHMDAMDGSTCVASYDYPTGAINAEWGYFHI